MHVLFERERIFCLDVVPFIIVIFIDSANEMFFYTH